MHVAAQCHHHLLHPGQNLGRDNRPLTVNARRPDSLKAAAIRPTFIDLLRLTPLQKLVRFSISKPNERRSGGAHSGNMDRKMTRKTFSRWGVATGIFLTAATAAWGQTIPEWTPTVKWSKVVERCLSPVTLQDLGRR